MMVNNNIWLVVEPYPSEKCEFLSWDYDIPFFFGKMKFMFQTTNQMGISWEYLFSIRWLVQNPCFYFLKDG